MQVSTPTPGPWPTPTFIPTTEATPAILIDPNISNTYAEQVVQGYNQYVRNDIFGWAVILAIILGGIWSVIKHMQKM